MAKRNRHNTIARSPVVAKHKDGIDIVIPVYNLFDFLERCISRLPDAVGDLPVSLYIYDNASDKEDADEYYAKLKEFYPQYCPVVVRGKENIGFPRACNYMAKKGNRNFVMFLNSDIEMRPGSLVNMVRDFDDPEIGIVGAKLLFPAGTPHGPAGSVQHVGLWTNIRGEFSHAFVGWDADNPKVLKVRDVLAVTGAAFMTRRYIWELLGGFDENYGMGTWEDVDYCLSVSHLGKRVVVNQDAVGTHWTNATATKYRIPFPIQRNQQYFMMKWAEKYPFTQIMYS